MDGRMEKRTDEQTDGWTDGRMDERTGDEVGLVDSKWIGSTDRWELAAIISLHFNVRRALY